MLKIQLFYDHLLAIQHVDTSVSRTAIQANTCQRVVDTFFASEVISITDVGDVRCRVIVKETFDHMAARLLSSLFATR